MNLDQETANKLTEIVSHLDRLDTAFSILFLLLCLLLFFIVSLGSRVVPKLARIVELLEQDADYDDTADGPDFIHQGPGR